MPPRNGSPRPWTLPELDLVDSMRGQPVRDICEATGRSQSSVSNVLNRPERMAAARQRAADTVADTRQIASKERAGNSPKVNQVSAGIAKRLDIAASPERGTKGAPDAPCVSGASVQLEPVLIVADAHIPYHSTVWWDLLMQVGRFLKPVHIVIIGDFGDFYSVSDHDKDPEKANRLDWELSEVDKHLDQLDALGARDRLYIEGNHEDRLRRHLMKNPQLARVVSTEKLLRLRERGWEFVPYKDHAVRGAVHYTHDVGACGRNAVFKALDTYQHSVVTGHTHRLQYIVEGNAVGDVKLSCMFGWGGDINHIDYTNRATARKNWCLGMGYGYYDPSSGYSYLTPAPVIHGTVCVNGRLFRAA